MYRNRRMTLVRVTEVAENVLDLNKPCTWNSKELYRQIVEDQTKKGHLRRWQVPRKRPSEGMDNAA